MSQSISRVRDALSTQPRLSLAVLPTPIHEAARLREALGGPSRCPRILIKRDDLTALGLGGNKARKLEYLVADAQSQGATTLITTGAVQGSARPEPTIAAAFLKDVLDARQAGESVVHGESTIGYALDDEEGNLVHLAAYGR